MKHQGIDCEESDFLIGFVDEGDGVFLKGKGKGKG
jgi:hypothetical protein